MPDLLVLSDSFTCTLSEDRCLRSLVNSVGPGQATPRCRFDVQIMSSWKQSRPKRVRKKPLTFPLTALKGFRQRPCSRGELTPQRTLSYERGGRQGGIQENLLWVLSAPHCFCAAQPVVYQAFTLSSACELLPFPCEVPDCYPSSLDHRDIHALLSLSLESPVQTALHSI